MKIYTRRGDKGETSLRFGKRVSKASSIIAAIGTIDELNSYLGVILAEVSIGMAEKSAQFSCDQEILNILQTVQSELFAAGSDLAAASEAEFEFTASRITTLEKSIDKISEHLPKLQNFILPGGGILGARLHYARSICRRAERELVEALESAEFALNPIVLKYMNRLSDWLFIAARQQNYLEAIAETKWMKR